VLSSGGVLSCPSGASALLLGPMLLGARPPLFSLAF
jgi:glycerol uptake facilitator-like aquaporin